MSMNRDLIPYFVIISIVAVVAVVLLILSNISDENVAGEAFRLVPVSNIQKIQTPTTIQKIESLGVKSFAKLTRCELLPTQIKLTYDDGNIQYLDKYSCSNLKKIVRGCNLAGTESTLNYYNCQEGCNGGYCKEEDPSLFYYNYYELNTVSSCTEENDYIICNGLKSGTGLDKFQCHNDYSLEFNCDNHIDVNAIKCQEGCLQNVGVCKEDITLIEDQLLQIFMGNKDGCTSTGGYSDWIDTNDGRVYNIINLYEQQGIGQLAIESGLVAHQCYQDYLLDFQCGLSIDLEATRCDNGCVAEETPYGNQDHTNYGIPEDTHYTAYCR